MRLRIAFAAALATAGLLASIATAAADGNDDGGNYETTISSQHVGGVPIRLTPEGD
ncbi:hypothetical protein [Streptomyces vinaceus]|uniref:hypothetical protein n=1 Tax=Streptomyces vinaceus TaxID=1960 RepID=UPI0035D9B8D7